MRAKASFSPAGSPTTRSHPFVILSHGARVGFALVTRPLGGARLRLSEFFVAAAARRRGIGRSAALLLFNRFGGAWEIVEDEQNRAALAFWRSVIATLTDGRYRETRSARRSSPRVRGRRATAHGKLSALSRSPSVASAPAAAHGAGTRPCAIAACVPPLRVSPPRPGDRRPRRLRGRDRSPSRQS